MKGAACRVRRARPEDALRIRNAHVASIHGLCSKDYDRAAIRAWSEGKRPEHYRKAMREGETMFVALVGERIAGFSSTIGGEIRAVYVHPAFARRGIASRLLGAAEKAASRAGHRSLRVASSVTAQRFYQAHGYKTVRRARHRFRNGAQIACVLMRKPAPPKYRRIAHPAPTAA